MPAPADTAKPSSDLVRAAKDAAATAFEGSTADEVQDGVVTRFAPLIADLLDPDELPSSLLRGL